MKRKRRFPIFMVFLALTAGGFAQDITFSVPKTRADFEKTIQAEAARIKGRVGIYIKHIESGEEFGLDENQTFQLASVFKVPLLISLFKQIHLGKISLDDRIVLTSRMQTYGSGLLLHMKPGLNLSIQDLQLLMMARSDNTATDILYELVTSGEIAKMMTELGLKETVIDMNTRQLILAYLGLDPAKPLTIAELDTVPESFWTSAEFLEKHRSFEASRHDSSTPAEIGLLWEKLAKGEVISRERSDQILETMKQHTGAELILRYLPMATPISRKGGSLALAGENTVLNDTGLVWLPQNAGRLVICLFGNDLNEIHYEIKHKFGLIARAAFDYFLEKNKRTK